MKDLDFESSRDRPPAKGKASSCAMTPSNGVNRKWSTPLAVVAPTAVQAPLDGLSLDASSF